MGNNSRVKYKVKIYSNDIDMELEAIGYNEAESLISMKYKLEQNIHNSMNDRDIAKWKKAIHAISNELNHINHT